MAALLSSGLADAIKGAIAEGKPYLGICIGLQLLFERSEESPGVPGLGVLAGPVVRFPQERSRAEGLKIPHMGWNQIVKRRECALLRGVDSGSYVYFVHSYYPAPEDESIVATTTEYGVEFVSSVTRGSLFACQFHPEKSQQVGLKIIENFCAGLR